MSAEPAPHADGLVIRAFRTSDLAELAELNAYGLAAAGVAPEADAYGGQDFAQFDRTYGPASGGAMLIGEIHRRIIAMGGFRRIANHQCEIMRMRVHPDFQGRGYGRAILRALEDTARQYGYASAQLLTGRDQHPAIDLYQASGYEITEHLTASGMPSVHMEKALSVGHVQATDR